MRCEDCGATVVGEDIELGAILAGITVCEECLMSYERESDAYEAMRAETGESPCDWFERQLAYAEGRLIAAFDDGRRIKARPGAPEARAAMAGE